MSAARKPKPANTKPANTKKLTLLGKAVGSYPAGPAASTIETFENRWASRDYWICFDCAEFTSMCPVTGQPDFATIRIDYVADKRCIETKSLKFYLASYRNTRSFNEEIVNRILTDLVAASSPRRMAVHGRFSARGGICVTVDVGYPNHAAIAEARANHSH